METPASAAGQSQPQPPSTPPPASQHLPYAGWRKTIPAVDHDWIMKSAFRQGRRGLEMRTPLRLWHHPSPPLLTYSQPPRSADCFFASKFIHWAPYHMFHMQLSCPQSECKGHRLTSSSKAYKHTVRQIMDIDSYYNMASEYLECTRCKKRYISWSDVILRQMDIAHRRLFPAILTYRFLSAPVLYFPFYCKHQFPHAAVLMIYYGALFQNNCFPCIRESLQILAPYANSHRMT